MDPAVGLCSVCRHARVVENRRGSRFHLCLRSRNDPTFRKYPGLPVRSCRGYEAGRPVEGSHPTSDQESND